jgi:signal transduction histidine kinase
VGERSATRLRHLVEDLLLLAEAEHDGLSFAMAEVAPDEIAVAVAEEMAITATEQGVSLEVDALPVPGAMGDRGRLEQVMVNLVGNAIKFTPDGGDVTLRVRPTDGGWILGVHDTGIGVPADEISHLFDPFFRASTATKAVIGGSGLGMAVVQQVVRGHGGTAAVSSSPGAGTQIDITFPLVPSGHAGG